MMMIRKNLHTARKIALDFKKRMEAVKEYHDLMAQMEHLNKRLKIDRVSDAPEAQEIIVELKRAQSRINEILKLLTI